MSETWQVTPQPVRDYVEWASASASFFSTPDWAEAAIALGGEARFAWHPQRQVGVALACFDRGPWNVGIAGFPVAGRVWSEACSSTLADDAFELARVARLDMLRVNLSMSGRHDSTATAERPEAWIHDLAAWDAMHSRRLRKDLAFAHRACAGLRFEEPSADGCHALYAGALAARGAKARYGHDYFRSLASIAQRTDRVRLVGGVDSRGTLRGFAVLAIDGGVGYYLHGGADAEGRRAGISDVLLERLVLASREAGCDRFTLMASPWDQPGLLAFKRKWSDREGVASTYDVSTGLAGTVGRALARWQSRADRAAARAWFERNA